MNANRKVYAAWWLWARVAGWNPSAVQHGLTIDKVGEGTVTLYPPGDVYDENTQVELTAQADSGWVFSGWSGDLSGSQNPGTVTMDAEKTVIATFTDSGAEDGGNSDSSESGCFISIAKSNGYNFSLNEKGIFR